MVSDAQIEAYRQAWREASWEGDYSNRVRRGLEAVMPTRERLAQVIMAADEDTLGYERRYPPMDDYDNPQWVAYLSHADAVLALFTEGG